MFDYIPRSAFTVFCCWWPSIESRWSCRFRLASSYMSLWLWRSHSLESGLARPTRGGAYANSLWESSSSKSYFIWWSLARIAYYASVRLSNTIGAAAACLFCWPEMYGWRTCCDRYETFAFLDDNPVPLECCKASSSSFIGPLLFLAAKDFAGLITWVDSVLFFRTLG